LNISIKRLISLREVFAENINQKAISTDVYGRDDIYQWR